MIPGGKADKIPESEIAKTPQEKEDLAKGVKHEMEHTNDPDKALEIAKDHEVEQKAETGKSDYYTQMGKTNLALSKKKIKRSYFDPNDEVDFKPNGSYFWSNNSGYEVMLSPDGEYAKLKVSGSDKPPTDWLGIEFVVDEENPEYSGGMIPVIDPDGYNIPLNEVMRI